MRRWTLLALLLAVLLAVGWWLLFISPRNSEIAQARDELEAGRQQELVLRTQIRQLQEIRDSEVEYLAALGKLEALIPERPLLDEFIEQIYQLTESTGVDLLALAPTPPVEVPDSALRDITVDATVEGQFFEVLGFLFGLSDLERLVRVDGIAIVSGQDMSGATVLSVSLNLHLFTLADLLVVPNGNQDGQTPPAGEEGETTTTTATTTTTGEG